MSRPRFRRTGRWRRRLLQLLFVAILIGLVWLAGLIWFATGIPRDVADADLPTDAIVVLTGGSARLEAGLQLLAADRAKKLLISGVNQQVTLAELMHSAGLPPTDMPNDAEIACCITIGYRAGNTIGNARETAAWMAGNGFASLRLVTADYHMPRSLIELRRAMPDVTILPHPVFPEQVMREEWWLWPGTARLIVNEYHKYLAALVRGWLADRLGVEPG